MRGKGFSVLRNPARGDLYIQVLVETPQHLTRRQRELLEEFEAEARETRQRQPRKRGLLRQGEGVLRRRPGLAPFCRAHRPPAQPEHALTPTSAAGLECLTPR